MRHCRLRITNLKSATHKVLIFKEHHSVCPLVGIGTPPIPLPQASVPFPSDKRVGGHTRLRLKGWGSPNSDDWRKSVALCLLCAATTSQQRPIDERWWTMSIDKCLVECVELSPIPHSFDDSNTKTRSIQRYRTARLIVDYTPQSTHRVATAAF